MVGNILVNLKKAKHMAKEPKIMKMVASTLANSKMVNLTEKEK
jgi:hypothetical protein